MKNKGFNLDFQNCPCSHDVFTFEIQGLRNIGVANLRFPGCPNLEKYLRKKLEDVNPKIVQTINIPELSSRY